MYEIRRLAYEDLPALAKMYSYYAQHTVTTYCNHEVSPQYMNGLLRGPGHHCFVAVAEDGSIAGYVHLTPVFSILGKKYKVSTSPIQPVWVRSLHRNSRQKVRSPSPVE